MLRLLKIYKTLNAELSHDVAEWKFHTPRQGFYLAMIEDDAGVRQDRLKRSATLMPSRPESGGIAGIKHPLIAGGFSDQARILHVSLSKKHRGNDAAHHKEDRK